MSPEPVKQKKEPALSTGSPFARNIAERKSTEAAMRHRLRNETTVFMKGGHSYEPVPEQVQAPVPDAVENHGDETAQASHNQAAEPKLEKTVHRSSMKIKSSGTAHKKYKIVQQIDDRKHHVKRMDPQILKLDTIEQFRSSLKKSPMDVVFAKSSNNQK